jgi:hypothetical protein
MSDLDKLALVTELLGVVDRGKEPTLSPQAVNGLYDLLCRAGDSLSTEGGEED